MAHSPNTSFTALQPRLSLTPPPPLPLLPFLLPPSAAHWVYLWRIIFPVFFSSTVSLVKVRLSYAATVLIRAAVAAAPSSRVCVCVCSRFSEGGVWFGASCFSSCACLCITVCVYVCVRTCSSIGPCLPTSPRLPRRPPPHPMFVQTAPARSVALLHT